MSNQREEYWTTDVLHVLFRGAGIENCLPKPTRQIPTEGTRAKRRQAVAFITFGFGNDFRTHAKGTDQVVENAEHRKCCCARWQRKSHQLLHERPRVIVARTNVYTNRVGSFRWAVELPISSPPAC